jgi:hypothetical protein
VFPHLFIQVSFSRAEKVQVIHQNRPFPEQEIRLTVLGESGGSTTGYLTGVVRSIARVDSSSPVPEGAAVRIESADALLLGECRRCHATESRFEMQIVLQQVIPTVTSLANLVAAICEATPGRTVGEVRYVSVPAPIAH